MKRNMQIDVILRRPGSGVSFEKTRARRRVAYVSAICSVDRRAAMEKRTSSPTLGKSGFRQFFVADNRRA